MDGWMDGWVEGRMDGWKEAKAGLRIAYSNQQNETLNLIQIIDFPTWKRIVDNVRKESILDHVYVQDPTFVTNINSFVPTIGDHVMIIIDIVNHPEPPKIITKRS